MIRWITPYLGTIVAASFETAPGHVLLDVRDLVDKKGNSIDIISAKIDQGVSLLEAGKVVIIGCDYGISRSNSIAAGILSKYRHISFTEALRQVIDSTGEKEIKPELLNIVFLALNQKRKNLSDTGQNILITGGAGFVGRRVRKRLMDSGCSVIAPQRSEMDVLCGTSLLDLIIKEKKITQIIHLANPRIYTSNRAIGETISMLRNVIDVCCINDIHMIYPSGWEIYSGYQNLEIFANESLPANPKGPYAESKWLAEEMISHHRKTRKLSCCVLRSSPLYGPESDRPKFIRTYIEKALRDETITTHQYINSVPKLDLMHVNDFVSALVLALKKSFAGDINLGTGKLHGTDAIAAIIKSELKSKSKIKTVPIEDYVANIAMDCTMANKALGWAPKINFEDGIKEILFQSEEGISNVQSA